MGKQWVMTYTLSAGDDPAQTASPCFAEASPGLAQCLISVFGGGGDVGEYRRK